MSPVATSQTYRVPFYDPDNTAPGDSRFDICGSVKSDVPRNDYGVILETIPEVGARSCVTWDRPTRSARP